MYATFKQRSILRSEEAGYGEAIWHGRDTRKIELLSDYGRDPLQVGKAVGHVLGATGHGSCKAVIGKDTRLSGYMLETALASGLVSMGVDVFWGRK